MGTYFLRLCLTGRIVDVKFKIGNIDKTRILMNVHHVGVKSG